MGTQCGLVRRGGFGDLGDCELLELVRLRIGMSGGRGMSWRSGCVARLANELASRLQHDSFDYSEASESHESFDTTIAR